MTLPSMRAVLWDMDGTLVDTEPYWMSSEEELVREFGGTWTHEDALSVVGFGLNESARVLQRAGVDMGEQAIVDYLTDAVTAKLINLGVPFRPGAYELLRALRDAGIKTALVTMSLRRMATEVVDLIDFDAFDAIFAGDEVTRPKPFGDPYLMAADALGVAPNECVVVEDSPTGVAAGMDAGMVTVGIAHQVALADGAATELLTSLTGVSPDDLIALHERHTR